MLPTWFDNSTEQEHRNEKQSEQEGVERGGRTKGGGSLNNLFPAC